mgnify:CR=1 FL=1
MAIGAEINFGYLNGSYFNHPGSYTTISYVDDVWFFDGVQYPSAADDVPLYTSPIINLTDALYGGFGLLAIVPFCLAGSLIIMYLKNGGEKPLDPKLIIAVVVAGIFIEIGVVIAVLTINALSVV